MSSAESELRDELSRLEAEITVFERIASPSDQARADLEARRARRDRVAAALAELRG